MLNITTQNNTKRKEFIEHYNINVSDTYVIEKLMTCEQWQFKKISKSYIRFFEYKAKKGSTISYELSGEKIKSIVFNWVEGRYKIRKQNEDTKRHDIFMEAHAEKIQNLTKKK